MLRWNCSWGIWGKVFLPDSPKIPQFSPNISPKYNQYKGVTGSNEVFGGRGEWKLSAGAAWFGQPSPSPGSTSSGTSPHSSGSPSAGIDVVPLVQARRRRTARVLVVRPGHVRRARPHVAASVAPGGRGRVRWWG